MLRQRGFQVRIYLPPREHPPAHIHVVKDAGEVVLVIGQDYEIWIREVHNLSDRDVVAAYRIVEANVVMLLAEWRRYHDPQ